MPEPQEPTQRTEKGLEIPVPSREDFLRNMGKVAPPGETKRPAYEREQDDDAA